MYLIFKMLRNNWRNGRMCSFLIKSDNNTNLT